MELDVMNSESHASAPHAPAPAVQQSNNRATPSAAAAVAPLLHALFDNGLPVRFEFWDGSALGPRDGPGTVIVRSPTAVKRMLWAPGELGLGRAYVTGELETDGDVISVLRALHQGCPERPQNGGPHAAGRPQGRHTIGDPRSAPGAVPRWKRRRMGGAIPSSATPR